MFCTATERNAAKTNGATVEQAYRKKGSNPGRQANEIKSIYLCFESLLWPRFSLPLQRINTGIRCALLLQPGRLQSASRSARRRDKRIFNFLAEKSHGKWRKAKDWKCAGERFNVEIIRFLSRSLHFLLAITLSAPRSCCLCGEKNGWFFHLPMAFTTWFLPPCTILRHWCGIRLSQDERRNWKFSVRREQTKTIRLEVE